MRDDHGDGNDNSDDAADNAEENAAIRVMTLTRSRLQLRMRMRMRMAFVSLHVVIACVSLFSLLRLHVIAHVYVPMLALCGLRAPFQPRPACGARRSPVVRMLV